MHQKITAIDLGGTKTAIAFFEEKKLIKQEKHSSPEDPEDLLALLKAQITEHKSDAIAVAAAGYWDQDLILRQSFNLPNYINYDIWNRLSKELNVPIKLKTDLELAAMGEAIHGWNNEPESLLHINLGTGFSAGLYKDGQIFSTSYSPTLRLDFLVDQNFNKSSNLSSIITNLAFITSPQIITLAGGRTQGEKWQSEIEPAINKAISYLESKLTYPIQISKSKLENPALYGAMELAHQN